MGDELFEDPISEDQRIQQWRQLEAEWLGYQNQVRPEAARMASILIREYPSVSPDLAAGVAAAGYSWDDPTINEMIKRDSEEQGFWGRMIGAGTRPVIGTMWSMFDQAIARPFRMGTRLAQGEGFMEARRNSGQGLTANYISRTRAGEEDVSIFGRTGLVPQLEQAPLNRQGAGEKTLEYMEMGATPEEAKSYTEQWMANNYAPSAFTDSRSIAESTMLHYEDANGLTRSYHATPGRVTALPVTPFIEPETAPWRMLTGGLDITYDVAADPANPIIFKLNRVAKARRTAVASERFMTTEQATDQIATGYGGTKINDAGHAEGAVFHGGAADAQSGIVTGGYTDDVIEASRFAGETEGGLVHGVDELPPTVRDNFGQSGRIDQTMQADDVAEAFPQVAPDKVVDRARAYKAADPVERQQRLWESLDEQRDLADELEHLVDVEHGTALPRGAQRAQDLIDEADALIKKYEFKGRNRNDANRTRADVVEEHWDELSPEAQRYLRENAQWQDLETGARGRGLGDDGGVHGSHFWNLEMEVENALFKVDGADSLALEDLRQLFYNMDDGDNLLALADEYIEARRIRDLDDIFSPVADLSPEQAAMAERINLLTDADDAVRLLEGPIVPTGSFNADEIAKMREWGYAFTNRANYEGYARFMEEAARAGAKKVRGKMFVHPREFEKWIREGTSAIPMGGRKFVQWAKDATFHELRPRLPGMDDADIWRISRSNDTDLITDILETWYGMPRSGYKVPHRPGKILSQLEASRRGAPSRMARSQVSVWSRRERLSAYGRRQVAEMGNHSIDPYDMDPTFDTVMSYGDLLAVEAREIDNALRLMDPGTDVRHAVTGLPADPRYRANLLADRLFGWLKDDLVKEGAFGIKGHSPELADLIIDEWRRSAVKGQQFAENTVGTPLELRTAPGRRIVAENTDEVLDLVGSDPLLDSQLGHRFMFMPTTRDVRRVTSLIRKKTEPWRLAHKHSVVGLGTSRSQAIIDGMMATWRSAALLRIGWVMRVIPDEMARFYTYGYSDLGNHPLASIMMSLGKKGDTLANGQSLRALTEVSGLGADNGLLHGLQDLPYIETSLRGASWTAQKASLDGVTLTSNGAIGVSRRMLQLNQSKLARAIADHGTIDDVVYYFSKTEEGKAVLYDLARRSAEGKQLYKAANDPTELRHLLEAIDAQRHQYAGGQWVGRDKNGLWVHDDGTAVNTWTVKPDGVAYTRAELADELAKRGVAGPRGGRPTGSLDELRSQLFADEGLPADLLKRTDSYIVTKHGDQRLLNVIRHGTTDVAPSASQSRIAAGRRWFENHVHTSETRSDYVWVVGDKGGLDASVASRAYRDLDDASRHLGVDEVLYVVEKESLPPRVFLDGNGSALRIELPAGHGGTVTASIPGDELVRMSDEITAEGATRLLGEDMTKADLVNFEGYLKTAYSEQYPPVQSVSVPDKPYITAADQKGIIDTLFRVLGRNPTLAVTRRPFVTLRTWEITAEHYVNASPAIRLKLMAAAEEAGMGTRFTGFVDQALATRGWKAPKPSGAYASVDEITELAWMEAVENTKDLFYDLTKGGAWQDGARLVFPFADAWWEVMSRWAGLMNPARTGAQPLKLARRISQGYYGAESSGYFTTNDQGERVFEIPGAGSLFNRLNPDSPIRFSPQIGMDQLTFVDFGSPSSAMRPGFSPPAQLAAGKVRNTLFDNNILPQSWKDTYDTVFFGQFSSPDTTDPFDVIGLFLPTWTRRIISRVFEGEFDDRYGSMVTRILNGYANAAIEDIATDRQAAVALGEQAHQVGSWMATVDIFTSFITPAQPRNVIELIGIDEKGAEHAKSITALAADFLLFKQTYGVDEAIDIFQNMYGVDPLKLAPATWSGLKSPVTADAWDFYQEHQELETATPFTLMAWLPEDVGDFDIDAWRAQDRKTLSWEDAVRWMSYGAGAHRQGALMEQRDTLYDDLEERYGGRDNNAFRYMRDEVIDPWYKMEQASIYVQYWAHDAGEGVPGLTTRPSAKVVWNEMRNIADPASDANRVARDADPELLGFVEFAMSEWTTVETASMNAGHGIEWWQVSTSDTSGGPTLRDMFVDRLNSYASGMTSDGKRKAEWIGQFILAPLLEGFDWDNPVIIAPSSPSDEMLGYADQLNER